MVTHAAFRSDPRNVAWRLTQRCVVTTQFCGLWGPIDLEGSGRAGDYLGFKVSVCSVGPGRSGTGWPWTHSAWPARK